MDERAKIRALLDYWMEHNREHGQEFREWAEKARLLGEDEVAKQILAAAVEVDKANEFLSLALRRLGGEECV